MRWIVTSRTVAVAGPLSHLTGDSDQHHRDTNVACPTRWLVSPIAQLVSPSHHWIGVRWLDRYPIGTARTNAGSQWPPDRADPLSTVRL